MKYFTFSKEENILQMKLNGLKKRGKALPLLSRLKSFVSYFLYKRALWSMLENNQCVVFATSANIWHILFLKKFKP
jgi:hypothetical protein